MSKKKLYTAEETVHWILEEISNDFSSTMGKWEIWAKTPKWKNQNFLIY